MSESWWKVNGGREPEDAATRVNAVHPAFQWWMSAEDIRVVTTELNHDALKALADAGWTAERECDVANWVEKYSALEYSITPQLKDLLSRFGGLVLSDWHWNFDIDEVLVREARSRSRLRYCWPVPAVPVGLDADGDLSIFLDEQGWLIEDVPQWTTVVRGVTIVHALNRDRGIPIGDWNAGTRFAR